MNSVGCWKIQDKKNVIHVVRWKVFVKEDPLDNLIKRLGTLQKRPNTLVVVTDDKIEPWKCFVSFLYAEDSFSLKKNRSKTIDMETLLHIYAENRISKVQERIKVNSKTKGYYYVCIIYPFKHPGPKVLPVPPSEPANCKDLVLPATKHGVDELVSLVMTHIALVSKS